LSDDFSVEDFSNLIAMSRVQLHRKLKGLLDLSPSELIRSIRLKKAAERAFKRAGITNPKTAFDVIELSDQYAYQLPMWAEGIGICDEGKGRHWLDTDGPVKQNVNTSGGMLSGNPLILGGFIRAAEAVIQLRGEAGDRQVDNAKTAIAHGVMGPAGQFHSVITLARD